MLERLAVGDYEGTLIAARAALAVSYSPDFAEDRLCQPFSLPTPLLTVAQDVHGAYPHDEWIAHFEARVRAYDEAFGVRETAVIIEAISSTRFVQIE